MPAAPAPASRRLRARRAVTGLAAAAVVASGLVVVTTSDIASARSIRSQVVQVASDYARNHGYKAGIAVLDTKTGELIGNKSRRSEFASESVIKVMIAARLLVQKRMKGATSRRARTMIACSNDNIANSFYGSVGGDGLLNWTKKYFKVPTLGHGPIRGNWWGSNRITAEGMVRLYAKLKADRRVGPWLLSAMHAHTKRGCDGFYQAFGLPQAASNVAVKQGWGADFSYRTPNASQNSTGFVDGDRYAIAILARGKASTYGSRLGNMITGIAKRLLPGRHFPSGAPEVTSMSVRTGTTAGGTGTALGGKEFEAVAQVTFGGVPAPFRVVSRAAIVVYAPAHAAGSVPVVVYNRYGTSSGRSLFSYVTPTPPTPKPTPKPTPTTSTAPTPARAATTTGTTAAASPSGAGG